MNLDLLTVMSKEGAAKAWSLFDGVLTIEDRTERDGLRFPADNGTEQAILKFDDVVSDLHGRHPPEEHQIAEALAFARNFTDRRLLIHCEMGVSRSAAVTLAILAERYGRCMEHEAAAHLLRIRPVAACNERIVEMADKLLESEGRLIAAWKRADEARFSGGFYIPAA
jgi:predicted protein tyrosine phosphatase